MSATLPVASGSRHPRVSSVASVQSASSSTRQSSHLETLVHSLVPSIAPTRVRTGSASSSRPGSRLSEHEPPQPSERELERERRKRERVKELARGCQTLLNDPYVCYLSTQLSYADDSSQIKSSTIAPPTVPDTARRQLHSTSPDAALKFTSAWHKLQGSTGAGRGKTLRDPLPHLQFLMALSKPGSSSQAMPPPPPPVASSSRPPRSSTSTPVSIPAVDTPKVAEPALLPVIDVKGKTKAEVLREWRTAQCESASALTKC